MNNRIFYHKSPRKFIFASIVAIILVSLISVSAFADSTDNSKPYNPDDYEHGNNVVDNADLLTDDEESSLRSRIEKIYDEYQYDVVILTENSIGDATPRAYADDYYDYNGYGYTGTYDGMLFLVSMDSRDYYTSTFGYGEEAFTLYYLDIIHEDVAEYLSNADYVRAYNCYLDYVEKGLAEAKTNEPYSNNNLYQTVGDIIILEVIVFVISLIIAFISVAVMKSKMKTAVPQVAAQNYIRPDSLNITDNRDVFSHKTVTKVYIPPSDSSSKGGSGSGSHTSSSGRSHGGSGGKF